MVKVEGSSIATYRLGFLSLKPLLPYLKYYLYEILKDLNMGKYPKEITVYYKHRNEKGKSRISQAWFMPLMEKTIVVNNEVEEREQLERSEAAKQFDAKWREQWRQLREYQYRKNNPKLYEPTSGKADSQVTYTRQEQISFLKVILIIGLIGLVIYLFL